MPVFRVKGDGVQSRQLHGDIYGILAAIFMQDGPYLGLRLYMIIQHKISGELQLFFAGKNAVTIALLLYRLYALQCKRKEDEEVYSRQMRAASDAILHATFLKEFNKSRDLDVNGNKDRIRKQISFEAKA